MSGRDLQGFGLALLNRAASSSVLDGLRLRGPMERAVFRTSRAAFRAAGAANRSFKPVRRLGGPVRPTAVRASGLFDLTPSDEQALVAETAREFATEQLRPAAAAADEACKAPTDLINAAAELGMSLVGIPEELGGAGDERSAVTNVLAAEALAHGDLGLAVACLAPGAVSTALVLWGDELQQSTYLPEFVGENTPAAALAVLEPQPLFDPTVLTTKARPAGGGYRLDGVKSLVPLASSAELFVIAADVEDSGPALFLVESGTAGLTVEPEPAMGLRGASTGRVVLESVTLPGTALLTSDGYRECIRLARLGWCALALGTAQAVLDYVIPYVNDREAFGEPISHRQGVAFTVADMATELEGAKLATYRAASRAEQGRSFARETALARRLCATHGMRIGSDGVQLLGGHGFVKEHPVERWYRDLRSIGVMEGAVLV